jgi:hypothetical protein
MPGQRFEPGTFRIQASGLFSDSSSAYKQATPISLHWDLSLTCLQLEAVGRLNFKNIFYLNVFCQGPNT